MTADLQDLFDQAGRNPPARGLDADAVLRKARRSRNNRRTIGAVAATVAVTLALVVGLASQRRHSADPDPVAPVPTVQALGSLGRLAYGIDGDIYVADADGENPVRIADGAPSKSDCGGYWGEGPIWSPDGRYLAYRGGDDGEPGSYPCNRTVNISDSAGHHVASFPGDGWAIAWSPDSTRVAVWDDFYENPKLQIYGLDGVRQALLAMPRGWAASGDFDPVWSPDGASILVHGGAQIPVDGSTPKELSVDDPRSQWTARYSPDGADIAYISQDGLGVAAADGSQARVLVPGVLGEDFPLTPYGLDWSPTGDRIAFVRATGDRTEKRGPATELAVLDVASGSVVPLAETGGAYGLHYIKFSPEGDQILFTRTHDTGASSLWSVHADGSAPHRLVAGTDWGDWQWVPTR
jgi:Tol biopolymer transport system component